MMPYSPTSLQDALGASFSKGEPLNSFKRSKGYGGCVVVVDDVDLWQLKPGHKIRTQNGAEAEVLSETEDGERIKVRYLEAKDEPSLVGTEDHVNERDIEAIDLGC